MNDVKALALAVSNLKSPRFSGDLAAYLKTRLAFDHLLILGCRADKHPIYLYDSISRQREFLFQRYLTGSYLQDPFYLAAPCHEKSAVLRLQDVVSDELAFGRYQQQFIQHTGLQDELCFVSRLDAQRWLLVFIGTADANQTRFQQNYKTLVQLEPLVHALLWQHWGAQEFTRSAASADKTGLQQALVAAMASFGSPLLSHREQEIALLLIQGFDSQDIAALSGISLGTVKNHRKKIYAKLHVASLSELFQVFLTHLLAS